MYAQKKRLDYRKEKLSDAVKSVKKGERNILQAATEFGVPRSTLTDKLKNNHPGVYGKKTALSSEDEEILVGYINYMASINHPLSVSDIKIFAWSVGKRSSDPDCFGKNGPTHKWWRGFRDRHPRLRSRKADRLDRRRHAMSKKSIVEKHLQLLKDTLAKHDLLDKPDRIFNVDESGMEMDKAYGKVVVDRKSKNVYQESNGQREHITANVCCSASGTVLPPMIIFEKCFPSGHYSKDGPEDCLYAKSPNGYMDGELFKAWFQKIFLPKTAHLGTVMLILDGHTSHLTIDVIDLARANNVVMFCLPPHLTHLLQPLDVSVFKSLKTYFAAISHQVKLLTLGTVNVINVNRTNFSAIFREAFDKSMVLTCIKNGFRKCGIYPFNPAAIDWSKLAADDSMPSSSASSAVASTASTSSAVIPAAIRHNPILEHNIIPERLLECLVIPSLTEAKTKNPRIITTARVLTSDEHRDQVKAKQEADRKAEEGKEQRRQERKRKRDEKESKAKVNAAKKEKKAGKSTKSIPDPVKLTRTSRRLADTDRKDYAKMVTGEESSSDDDVSEICGGCHKENPKGASDMIDWWQCPGCSLWYHLLCESPTGIIGSELCEECTEQT